MRRSRRKPLSGLLSRLMKLFQRSPVPAYGRECRACHRKTPHVGEDGLCNRCWGSLW